MVVVTVMLEHSGGGGGSTAGPIATAMLRSILSGENALEVRNSIYYRMQSIYEQLRLAREQAAAEEMGNNYNNAEEDNSKKKNRNTDDRIRYE